MRIRGKPVRRKPQRINQDILRFLDLFGFEKGNGRTSDSASKLGFIDLLTRSFDVTQDRVIALMIDLHKPDIVVNVSREVCGIFDFHLAEDVIEAGRIAFRDSFQHSSAGNE